MGPLPNIENIKKTVPSATSFGKFFFYSGMKLRIIDVIVYVIVSIEKMIPTSHTGIFSSFNLN